MSGGWDEVYAAVDSGVRDPLLPVDVDLLLQVGLVLVIDELHDGLPAGRRGTEKHDKGDNVKRRSRRGGGSDTGGRRGDGAGGGNAGRIGRLTSSRC